MENSRVVKVARDKSPLGRRSTGRPRKRWNDNLEVERQDVEDKTDD